MGAEMTAEKVPMIMIRINFIYCQPSLNSFIKGQRQIPKLTDKNN